MTMLNLKGERFGRLVIIKRAADGTLPSGGQYVRWHARCDCGGKSVVSTAHLRAGETTSCGCKRRDNKIGPYIKHGEGGSSKSAEYRAWISMKNRCQNPRQARYADYGGRGIKVCLKWRRSFPAFLADMGRKPSAKHTLDRKNNDGNYTPGNCRWATPEEQRKNQRRRARLDQFSDAEIIKELRRRRIAPQYHNAFPQPETGT